jgi:DNA-binding XRE family transcriptional regulator
MQAIGCLISGMSQTKTSEVCGVTRRTINHWNKLPEFKKVLRNRRREALQASMAILQNASVELALNLVKLAKTSFEPSDQIRATIQALKFANEQVFVEEITDRLDAIESSRNAPVTNGATYSVVKGNDET